MCWPVYFSVLYTQDVVTSSWSACFSVLRIQVCWPLFQCSSPTRCANLITFCLFQRASFFRRHPQDVLTSLPSACSSILHSSPTRCANLITLCLFQHSSCTRDVLTSSHSACSSVLHTQDVVTSDSACFSVLHIQVCWPVFQLSSHTRCSNLITLHVPVFFTHKMC